MQTPGIAPITFVSFLWKEAQNSKTHTPGHWRLIQAEKLNWDYIKFLQEINIVIMKLYYRI